MRRIILATLVMAAWATQAQAQFGYQRPNTNPYGRPAVNPILNTLGPRSGGLGYYTQTRPQIDYNRNIGILQQNQLLQGQQLAGLQSGAALAVPGGTGITGHGATFFNYSHYYTFPSPRFGIGGSGGGAGNVPASSPVRDPNFGQAPTAPGIGIGIIVDSNRGGVNR